VFGGAASLFGTIASAFSISQTQSTLEFFLSGSMAKVITLLTIVGILMVRRRDSSHSRSASKNRQAITVMVINSRFFNRSELIGFVALALVLFVILPLSLDIFRLNLVAKYLTYALSASAWCCAGAMAAF